MRIFFFLTLFFILFCFPANLLSNTETDSLKEQLQFVEGKEKLEILQSFSLHYLFRSLDSCEKYSLATIKLAQHLNDIEIEALANKRLGYAFYRTGDYIKSLSYFKKAHQLFIKNHNYLQAAILTNFIGDAYSQKSDYPKAIHYYIETEQSCDTLINVDSTQTSVKRLYAILYTNLGLLYHRLDSVEKPLYYFNKALLFAEEINDSNRIAASYSNLGMMYKKMNDFDSAKLSYVKSLRISQKTGNRNNEIAALNNIASLYNKRGLSDSALIHYQKASQIATEIDYKYGLSLINRNIAEVYLSRGNYQPAIKNALLALKYAQKTGSLTEIYSNYQLLANITKAKGDYKKAFQYHLQYAALKDSVMGINIRENIADIQTKYETEKKEKENKLLKKDIDFEKRKANYLFVLSIVLILMGVVSLALFYFIRKTAITKKQLAESESSKMEIELESQKREITLGALSLSRNIEFINSLIGELKNLSDCVSEEGIPNLNNIVNKLSRQQSDSSWKEFEKRFSEIHSEFYSRLINEYPNLSQNEVKLSAFLKLGMNTKEICSITFQSVRAVEAARLRLRKKLGLNSGDNLSMFLQKL